MSEQQWIFTVHYYDTTLSNPLPLTNRVAVVGPARASTVEAALHLATVPEAQRTLIRADATVRAFVEGALDPNKNGYLTESSPRSEATWRSQPAWVICIGSVHQVLP